MSQKENLGANSKEQSTNPIDLRKATAIPNAAAAAHGYGSPTPNFIDRTGSPMTSLSTNFASQVHVSASAPSSARRSLSSQFDLSEPSTPETTPRFEQSLMFRIESVSDPIPRRTGLPQNVKSRSCSDVGALYMNEEASIFSPSSSMDSLSGYSSESSTLSSSSSSKILPPSFNPLSVSGTLPQDFKLALPIIKGSKANVNSISCETLCRLIDGHYNDVIEKYYIVDCRYPYEFNGGHIKNAINIHHPSSVISKFLSGYPGLQLRQRTVIVFHCEFSQERGPAAYQALRNADRHQNHVHYPELCYPDIYLLDGGYKSFFESCKEYCNPCAYLPMKDAAHKGECIAIRKEHKQQLLRTRSNSFHGGFVRSRHQAQGRVSPRPSELPPISEQGVSTDDEMSVDEPIPMADAPTRFATAPATVFDHDNSRSWSPSPLSTPPYTRRSSLMSVSPADSPPRLGSPMSPRYGSDMDEDDIPSPAARPPPKSLLLASKKYKSTPSLFPSPY
eukprot:TRINITY_DN15167_c0_g1_i1.p1 TRINITY_DN15167_c0_g1~~TRINITY_DN15167_c0_g1_i1.p1  ORF type:complete len:504 (-),score=57.18 TRINITY_DN15167_c0_g1_i1:118-1629(-)